MKVSTNNSLPELKAFKRAPSLGLSQWENGNLTTNLAEKKDTNGAFFLVEAMLAPGTEPPPHVHTRQNELSYVIEGEFDVYVGKEARRSLYEDWLCQYAVCRSPGSDDDTRSQVAIART